MESVAALYYVGPTGCVTAEQLRSLLGSERQMLSISIGIGLPKRASELVDSLVVIDLRGRCTPPKPSPLPATRKAVVVFLSESSLVPAAWVPFLRRPDVRIVSLSSSRDEERTFQQLGATLRLCATDCRRELIKTVLARNRAMLRGLEDIVDAVLSDPWGIRTPRDLAAAIGLPLESLAGRFEHLFPRRLEHCLTLIRWLAFEQLIGTMGMKVAQALRVVGIRDRSNLRRQWRRARYLVSG